MSATLERVAGPFRGIDDSRALVAAALIFSVASAVLITWVSFVAAVVATIAGVLVVALVVLHGLTRRNPMAPIAGEQGRVTEALAVRAGRLLFLAGCLTLGLLVFRTALGFTYSDWLFLGALMLVIAHLFMTGFRHDYRLPPELAFGIVVFAVGGIVASIDAVSPLGSASIVVRLVYLTLVWFWLATSVLRTVDHVRTATLLWVVSAGIAGAAAVAQLVLGGEVIPGGSTFYGRATGTAPHFNTLGGLTGIALIPAAALAIDGRGSRVRVVAGLAATGAAIGLVLSGSVGGFLAALAAGVCWLTVRGLNHRLAMGVVASIIAAGLALSALGGLETQSPTERLQSVTAADQVESGRGGTVFLRLEGYRLAWDRISHQPFVGVGLDEESSVTALGSKVTHNMLLNTWVSAGILGIVGLAIALFGAFRVGMRVVRDASDRSLAAALLAAFAGFFVNGMGEPILFVRYGWMPVALLFALYAQQRRSARSVLRGAPIDAVQTPRAFDGTAVAHTAGA